MEGYKLFIDGEWVDSEDEQTVDVINPASEDVIAKVPSASVQDAKKALEAAQQAQRQWEELAPLQRAKYLRKIAELIRENRERLARILTTEQGKPIYESRAEIEGSAENFAYYAEFARRIEGDILPADTPNRTIMILKLPLGVVVAITPWNFPSATVARKIAPALITGNTMVVKPSSNTPLSTLELVKLAQEAGLPKGVLNVVVGSGSTVGEELVKNDITQLVSMTGSTAAGQKIMQSAASHVSKLILELGGKAPFIVWEDADVSWAVKNAIWARFWNGGQTCICAERMYVQDKVANKFVPHFVDAVKSLRIGNPLEEGIDLGPRVSRNELKSGEEFVQKALEEGGKLLLGGRRPSQFNKGFWYEPTVITDTPQDSKLVQEEVFGPVVPILNVESFDDALEKANDSKYGLASYIFTKDLNKAMKAAHKLKFGETYINQVGPEAFQGAHTGFRLSGVGVEGSRYGVEGYTQLKTVYIDYSEESDVDYLMPYGNR